MYTVYIYIYIHIYIHTCIYIYIYIHTCVCSSFIGNSKPSVIRVNKVPGQHLGGEVFGPETGKASHRKAQLDVVSRLENPKKTIGNPRKT